MYEKNFLIAKAVGKFFMTCIRKRMGTVWD